MLRLSRVSHFFFVFGKEDALAVFRRRKIGFVFQAFNLVSSVNVWENIVLPLGLDGEWISKTIDYNPRRIKN